MPLCLTIFTFLASVVSATSLGGQGYVDLSVYGRVPDFKGAGILYGEPNAPAYSPYVAPAVNSWGPLFTGAGISGVRAGGAQIPYPGYATYLVNGDMSGYKQRFASTLNNYKHTRSLNPNAIFVLLPHDLWGADSVTSSTTVYPCDNNDCSGYNKFLAQLIGDLKSNDMLTRLHVDMWNEPDGAGFWPRTQDQFFLQYSTAWDAYRAALGTSVSLQAPATASQPAQDNSWWEKFGAYLQSNKSRTPDTYSAHQLNGRNSPNCGNDPVVTQAGLDYITNKYGLAKRPFQLNEYGASDEQTPAYTAWFIERFERTGIRGMRANWGSGVGLHNDLAKLLGPGGKSTSSSFYKLGDWHVLNYYTHVQQGLITRAGATVSSCYDLHVTQNRNAGVTNILAGTRGQEGAYPITISNVDSMPAYRGKSSLRAVIKEIPYNNGGRVDSPTLISNGSVPISANKVVINLTLTTDSAYTVDIYPE